MSTEFVHLAKRSSQPKDTGSKIGKHEPGDPTGVMAASMVLWQKVRTGLSHGLMWKDDNSGLDNLS